MTVASKAHAHHVRELPRIPYLEGPSPSLRCLLHKNWVDVFQVSAMPRDIRVVVDIVHFVPSIGDVLQSTVGHRAPVP